MQISNLFKEKKAVISFEIFPPKSYSKIDTIYNTLDKLAPLNPDFISVTYGAGGNVSDTKTAEIASKIKSSYNIEPLAHLTCINSTRDEIKTVLNLLDNNKIENILAMRGDLVQGNTTIPDFKHAKDLIKFIKDEYNNFNILGTCYPEGHPESINEDLDIKYLKEKVNMGATSLISQLFFDNADFYNFLYQVRDTSINIPIQAGIMPVINKKSVQRIISLCGANLPKKFVKILNKFEDNKEALFDAAIAYATDQIIDLLSNNVQGIHLYTMNNPEVAIRIMQNINSTVKYINSKASE